MARKGNLQRNGLNRNTLNKKHTVPEEAHRSTSDGNNKLFPQKDLSTESSTSSNLSQAGLHDTKNIRSGKKNRDRDGSFPCQAMSEDNIRNLAPSLDNASNDGVFQSSDSLCDLSNSKKDSGSISGSGTSKGPSMRSMVDDYLSSLTHAGKRLEALVLLILEAARGWLERQKPHISSATTKIVNVRDYICARVKRVSPVIWSCFLQCGKVMLLLSLAWLDCTIRGLDSLLHLGTTSYFTVLWCSVLSVVAMTGIAKMLMTVVVAAVLCIFIGFALAILPIIILAIVMLWLYGNFWSTGFVILLGGVIFALKHEQVALLLFTGYSMYCAKTYIGWMGLLLGVNLSFITSDVLLYLLKNNLAENGSRGTRHNQHKDGHFFGEHGHSSPADNVGQTAFEGISDSGPGEPSTSGTETELTSESEVDRLLNCNDHYSALGLPRYENIDVASVKREYRRKAMLVHPDKNMGNEMAAEAFKKLQNAYEVLLDSLKRKTYDDELRKEELFNYLRRFQTSSLKNGRNGIFRSTYANFEADDGGLFGDSRRIDCSKCKMFHMWTLTERLKSHARWCQDCKEFHQAKDGDGWVEQAFQPLLFGLVHKMEAQTAYVCAGSRVYDATGWFLCQGLRCPANTHKPSFHVNTSVASRNSGTRGSNSHRSGGQPSGYTDETMSEEEFFEWLQNAAKSGVFDTGSSNMQTENPSPKSGSSSRSNIKKKRKGKKQW